MAERDKKLFEQLFSSPAIMILKDVKTKEYSFYKLDSLDFSQVEPITEDEATKFYSE